ncbi:SCA7-domain-containing protein [Lentinula aff. detonsa]|uniref:SCA7-domain-containing protein n=1 Tax=Lentinula aff. detonsa TaxID=2804958 RepID=A0AA38NMC6_9AGAR|nr:SCA7-domain-containing protein [Lentinula aff. detonsa]KAJ3798340.1 SCA7-domain-containing protein [Lentinula aff. detonsa]
MPLKLKGASTPLTEPFSWDDLPSPSPPPPEVSAVTEPTTVWLPARDMKIFGARPLSSTSEIGVVRCKDCDKPILKSAATEHAANCTQIRNIAMIAQAKKRKASPSSASLPGEPASKKVKKSALPKVTKGRMKGPVDYDKQCGVINDKGLPCSRSLTCKSHAMGAKRAVQGRSRPYDDLLLDWQREHNPNFVEPVKRETKKEKKEKKDREKAERKRAIEEAAVKLGLDPSSKEGRKAGAAATGHVISTSSKHGPSKRAQAAAAAAAAASANTLDDADNENYDDLDSEAEVDDLVGAVRQARTLGVIAQPLAVPSDAGSWFVERRERFRLAYHMIGVALNPAKMSNRRTFT